MKFNKFNWREHPDIVTDSLWFINERGPEGSASYPGNFIPDIPYQLIKRYTNEGDYVLDPFAGSGTTLDVATKLNRFCFTSDIRPTRPSIIKCDAAGQGYKNFVHTPVELVILHPPYSNIIVYSLQSNDLSNPDLSVEDFLIKFRRVLLNCIEVMTPTAHLAIVIGDKYELGHTIPLGFLCMQTALDCDLLLKATIVKNFGNSTNAKRNLEALWRYRAMVNGFYIFKHEYIFVFNQIQGK